MSAIQKDRGQHAGTPHNRMEAWIVTFDMMTFLDKGQWFGLIKKSQAVGFIFYPIKNVYQKAASTLLFQPMT